MIYLFHDKVIPWIDQVILYGLNTIFKLTEYLKN